MMLKFKVEHQDLVLLTTDTVVADSEDYLQMHFDFTDDWQDVIIIALFSRGENNIRAFLDDNNTVKVPWNVLKGEGSFDVSVFGVNLENAQNKVITSSVATIQVEKSGLKNGETFDESNFGIEGSVLYQILHKVDEAQEKVDKAAAWAEANTEVEEGKFSAKHYAAAAGNSATDAGRSATNAANSEGAAARSATAAETAAGNAQRAAETAAQDAATKAAQLAAEQTSNTITQMFTELLNAPHYSYDAQGHLIFVYGREVG